MGEVSEALAAFEAAAGARPGTRRRGLQCRHGTSRAGGIRHRLGAIRGALERQPVRAATAQLRGAAVARRRAAGRQNHPAARRAGFRRYAAVRALCRRASRRWAPPCCWRSSRRCRYLLAATPGISGIFAGGEPLPRFDVAVPADELAARLRHRARHDPGRCFLCDAAAPIASRAGRRAFDALGAPRVGLVWAGRPTHLNDRNRSIPLTRLLPLLADPHTVFVSLQRDIRPEDAAVLQAHPQIVDLGAELSDFFLKRGAGGLSWQGIGTNHCSDWLYLAALATAPAAAQDYPNRTIRVHRAVRRRRPDRRVHPRARRGTAQGARPADRDGEPPRRRHASSARPRSRRPRPTATRC